MVADPLTLLLNAPLYLQLLLLEAAGTAVLGIAAGVLALEARYHRRKDRKAWKAWDAMIARALDNQ